MKSIKDAGLLVAEYFMRGFLVACAVAGAVTGIVAFMFTLAAICSYAYKAGWNLLP